jgi:aspartate/methionine/tyrosine aminotransferase
VRQAAGGGRTGQVSQPRLFAGFTAAGPRAGQPSSPAAPVLVPDSGATLEAIVDEQVVDLFRAARNPDDPLELRDLYLARAEALLARPRRLPGSVTAVSRAGSRRAVTTAEVLDSPALPRMVKELFNYFFRDDLYGRHRSADHLILSSGSVDEEHYGLPPALKHAISYALDRDWYGYSDSRGRVPARQAVAALENVKIPEAAYGEDNIAISMGGTFAISAIADFLLSGRDTPPALCAVPNYPPLVASMARRAKVRLVPVQAGNGVTDLEPLISALEPGTPMVLLQTVTNPTGTAVDEASLARLIERAGSTMVVLDECHECLGAPRRRSPARAASNVLRVNSLSKSYAVPGLKIGWVVADKAFIDDFYEYASTTYGGPPSFLYTLVEVTSRMERWLILGLTEPGHREAAEFESGYGLRLGELAAAYRQFAADRQRRERELTQIRDAAFGRLVAGGMTAIRAPYSVNLVVRSPRFTDGYSAYRHLLQTSGTAVFPGILTFCLDPSWVRITTARKAATIEEGVRRLVTALG